MIGVRYLAPVLILCIGAVIYELPIGDLKVIFLPLTWLPSLARTVGNQRNPRYPLPGERDHSARVIDEGL